MQNVVNIIVIGYALPQAEKECLKSVISNTKHPYVLTYFNNYKSGYTLTQIWNTLINSSNCEYVCLLNNDTVVYPGWLERMVSTIANDKGIGFVGPSTNACHSPQKTIPTHELAEANLGKVEIMKEPISGFCLLFRKTTWVKLNGFDEKYELYGQESDFIDRAKSLGLHSAWVKGAFVFHHGELSVKTHGIDVAKERTKAKAVYWAARGK